MTSPKRGTTTRNACNRLCDSAGGRIIPVNLSSIDKHGCESLKARGASRNSARCAAFSILSTSFGGLGGMASAMPVTLRVPRSLTSTQAAARCESWVAVVHQAQLEHFMATSPGASPRQPSRILSFDEQHRSRIDAAIEAEDKAVKAIKRMARNNSAALLALWHWGDGDGGSILDMLAKEVGKRQPSAPLPPAYKIVKGKKVIPQHLRTKVFERDAYRCLHCGTHLNLTVDHIKPESKGGTLDFDNLQTLCAPCNSSKGTKE